MSKDSLKFATITASVLSFITLTLILVIVPSLIAHINDTYALLDGDMNEFRESTEQSWATVIEVQQSRRLVKRQTVFNNAVKPQSFGVAGACQCDASPNGCPPGPPGPPGPKGENGDDGDAGEKGLPGAPSSETMPETDVPADENCFYCPHGPMGPPGAKGRSGPRGMRGSKGKPGNNACDGNPGPPGQMGAPGPEGPFGNPGNKGDAGANGAVVVGRPGQKGIPGDKGPAGAKGFSGSDAPNAGDAGTPGPEGRPGLQGPAGMEGVTGPTGAEGESGDDAQYCSCPLRDAGVVEENNGGDGGYDVPEQPY